MGLELNLVYRQKLIHKLALESEYFESFLVRSEAYLKTREGPKGIRLLKHHRPQEGYRSVLDWLIAVMVPGMKQKIKAYYENEGPRLGEEFSPGFIDNLDQKLNMVLHALTRFHEELWMNSLYDRRTKMELSVAAVDLMFRPSMPNVEPCEMTIREVGT